MFLGLWNPCGIHVNSMVWRKFPPSGYPYKDSMGIPTNAFVSADLAMEQLIVAEAQDLFCTDGEFQ